VACGWLKVIFWGSVAAKIKSPLESDLSLYFLQIQKGPTDLFEGFPGNTLIDPMGLTICLQNLIV
jgi:hypothetical protein